MLGADDALPGARARSRRAPANHGYKPGFATALMLKDLTLSQEAAQAAGAATPLGAQGGRALRRFEEAGHGGDDYSAIVTYLRDGPTPAG